MQCNAAGIALIKEFEGCRLDAYEDQGGVPTIGWGQTGPSVQMGMTISQSQADEWLTEQIQNVSTSLSRMLTNPINENQFAACVSLAYNIGLGNFASSSARQLINIGALADVPVHIGMWNEVNHAVDPGLVRRRNAEIALWNTPVSA